VIRQSGSLRRATTRDIQMQYCRMKAEDVQRDIARGEERSRIDRELKGR
jgi:hypothetical protein